MANQRTADLIIGAFKDEMTTRRKPMTWKWLK